MIGAGEQYRVRLSAFYRGEQLGRPSFAGRLVTVREVSDTTAICTHDNGVIMTYPLSGLEAPRDGTFVVHAKVDPFDVYCGRPMPGYVATGYGNPFKVRPHDSGTGPAVGDFCQLLMEAPRRIRVIPDLRGKRLACWCKTPDAPLTLCHCDVYRRLLAEFDDEALHRVIPQVVSTLLVYSGAAYRGTWLEEWR